MDWMHHDEEAMKKLCLRVRSEFLDANDTLFSFGEMNNSVGVGVRSAPGLGLASFDHTANL